MNDNAKVFFDDSDSDASYMIQPKNFETSSLQNQTPAAKVMMTSGSKNGTPISNPADDFLFKTAGNLKKQIGNVIYDDSSNNSSELKAVISDRHSDAIPEEPAENFYQTNSPYLKNQTPPNIPQGINLLNLDKVYNKKNMRYYKEEDEEVDEKIFEYTDREGVDKKAQDIFETNYNSNLANNFKGPERSLMSQMKQPI